MYKIGFNIGLSKGGPSIFIDRLKRSLKKLKLNKISYFFDPSIDIYLCINRKFYNPWHKPIVFRLDGVPHKKFLISNKFDKNTNTFYKNLNNGSGIIYQSKFCKLITEKFFKLDPNIPNTIIYNGIDLKLFKKKGSNLRKFLGIKSNDIVFICSANFRSKNKRLKSIINSFNKYKTKKKIKKYLIILGSINEKIGVNKKMLDSKYIITPGKIDVINLPEWYRTGDIFLHFTYVDFCPNAVIEAIASKLPILCTNLGGTKELVNITNSGIVVKADKNKNLGKINMWNPPEPNQKLILKYMSKIVKDKKLISKKINLDSINIDKVSRQYSNFINKIKN